MPVTKYTCTVTQNKEITPTCFELDFTTDQPIEFKGGQFVSVVIPGAGPNGRNLRRAYSIASWPERSPLQLCIKLLEDGPGTNYLHRLKGGDSFELYAPYGDFVFKTPPHRTAFFIATGTGVAPFRSMVYSKEYQDAPPKKALALFGTTTKEELLYREELSQKVEWVGCLSRNQDPSWDGVDGRVTQYIKSLPNNFPWSEVDFYLCGNGDMIKEVKAYLLEKGVEKSAIFQEIYYKPKDSEQSPK